MKLINTKVGLKSNLAGQLFPCYIVTENNIEEALKLFSKKHLVKHLNSLFRHICLSVYQDCVDEETGILNKKHFANDLRIVLKGKTQKEVAFDNKQRSIIRQRWKQKKNEMESKKNNILSKLTAEERQLLGV